ncbi:hypothetical protein COOONC_08871, partial [Cooperia oncophora]
MGISTEWIDVLFPIAADEFSTLRSAPNGARDSLRALLLLTLFALTFAAAMLATVLRGDWARSHITSFIACMGGGVFLATCMLDLLPDAIESFEKSGFDSNFPIAEAAVAGGLLLVLTIEQVVLTLQERGWLSSGHLHLHDEGESSHPQDLSLQDDTEQDANPMLGACLLVLALSLHALFEGLSLAVISDASKLLEVFAALILHKCIIGFSLGVRLVQSGMRTPWVALCACLFSIQVLIGGLGGMEIMSLISGGDRSTAALVSTILQGIACGTFLYITTFEVLPHELRKAGNRLSKLFCLFLGGYETGIVFFQLTCFVLICVELVKTYLGLCLSWFLSVVIRCPLEIGSVGWWRLSDVRIRLPSGLNVYVDVCQLQLFSVLVSKPLLLSLSNVKVEGDARLLAQASPRRNGAPIRRSSSKHSLFSRVTQLIQYCGLYVTRGHLVLFDALPGCIFHVTIDELLVETFRSRDGWQLETSCMMTRAKAIRRPPTPDHSLFDLGLQFRLSIDIAGGRLKTISFHVTDPTVELSSGVFDELDEHVDSFKLPENAFENPSGVPSGKELFSIEHLSDLCIETNNCLLKYHSISSGESRMLTIALRGLSVTKDSGKTQTRVVGLSIEDQRQRLALRTSLLVLSHEKRAAGVGVQVISDSVQTSLSMQDVAWWKVHVDSVLPVIRKAVGQSTPVAPSTPPRIPVTFSVEVASIFCDLVDADAFQSTLSVQFLSITKEEHLLEVGVDCLCIAGPSIQLIDATFERHQWGQSVYIGAALVQQNLNEPDLLVGIDDCKIEWSDKLANQLKKLASVFSSKRASATTVSVTRRTSNIRLQLKRAAIFSLAKETSYLAWLCDELAAESTSSCDLVVSAQKTRLVSGVISDTFVDLPLLYNVKKCVPPLLKEEDGPPWRCWNQSENDARKNRRRTAFGEKIAKEPQLCGETNMLCVSIETLVTSVRNVTISSGTRLYLVWSPLLHRVIYHMIQVVKRVVWLIPSLTFDYSPAGLTAVSPQLTISMDGADIVTAMDVYITRRPFDAQMDSFRRGFDNCTTLSNKVWTWTAASFLFYLPYEFNFAQVFDEFINCIKWIKVVHGLKSAPFKPGGPLPADFRLVFK